MCMYCEKGRQLDELMIHVAELSCSNVYLVRNQNYLGRCVVAYREHKKETFELAKKELLGFFSDVASVAGALSEIYQADKINYGIYGDTVPHLHCHVAPKKDGAYGWGSPFALSGNDTFPDDAELSKRAACIKARLVGEGVC